MTPLVELVKELGLMGVIVFLFVLQWWSTYKRSARLEAKFFDGDGNGGPGAFEKLSKKVDGLSNTVGNLSARVGMLPCRIEDKCPRSPSPMNLQEAEE